MNTLKLMWEVAKESVVFAIRDFFSPITNFKRLFKKEENRDA
jgi:hypothetical protein